MQLADTAAWLLAKGLVSAPESSAKGSAIAQRSEGGADEGLEGCTVPMVMWMNGLTGKAGGSQPAEDLMYK